MARRTKRPARAVTDMTPASIGHNGGPPINAIGGMEGAATFDREMATWRVPVLSPDKAINLAKTTTDSRSLDLVQNDGQIRGVVGIHRDSIVGATYRLNAQPNWRVLGADERWAEEFQTVVEPRFNLVAESPSHWLDAQRVNTFTGQIRLALGGFLMTGEVLATAEWIREAGRPCRTALQQISPHRLSNPDGQADTRFLRRGIVRDARGRPLGCWIRKGYPGDTYDAREFEWVYVPIEKPWGRRQVIHIYEALLPDQSRGISDMVSILRLSRMAKKYRDISLQNAVINASYAAAIESELPPEVIAAAMGSGQNSVEGMMTAYGAYMEAMAAYFGGGSNIEIDGAKIPHFFPGTKLNTKPLGTPGGVGSDFEKSLNRHLSAALGISYEELTHDFSETNYSSATAAANNTEKFMRSRKKAVADRYADEVYALWLEEEISAGNVPLPRGKTADFFYEPLMKEAFCQASWIGTARGQVDQLKETQAAILRVKAGLSTYEKEIARLGDDYREVFAQRAREEGLIKSHNLAFSLDAQKSAQGQGTQGTLADDPNAEREAA